MDGIAEGKVLLLTWANHHYLDFAMNWVGHMQKLGVTAYMIGALDNALLQVGAAAAALALMGAAAEPSNPGSVDPWASIHVV